MLFKSVLIFPSNQDIKISDQVPPEVGQSRPLNSLAPTSIRLVSLWSQLLQDQGHTWTGIT